MKLYYAPNTISVATAIVLEEAGIAFEPVRVDFATAEQTKAAYQAINPKGRVPALITDRGILTETGAILEYIASTAPAANLVPDDHWEAAQMRALMYYLASTMHVNHAHKLRGIRWVTQDSSIEDMVAKVPQTMADSCRVVEENALVGPYVMGERFTIVDPYLYTICTWLEGDGVDVSEFPKIKQFMALMETRPSIMTLREKGIL